MRAARVLGLEIAGVDLLRSNKGPLVLEVNSSPGLEGIEGTTGVDVAAFNCLLIGVKTAGSPEPVADEIASWIEADYVVVTAGQYDLVVEVVATDRRELLELTNRMRALDGVVLTTARALGEFGAVSVVSGRLAGQTESLTLYVQDRYQAFDEVGAYASAVVLALIAVATLIVMTVLEPKEETR